MSTNGDSLINSRPPNPTTRQTDTGQTLISIPKNKPLDQYLIRTLDKDNFPVSDKTYSDIIRLNEILYSQQAATHEDNKPGRGERMDESVKMILERLERDSREREERYHRDAQERELRYREESKESEKRIERIVTDLRNEVKLDFKSFEAKLDKMESKIDKMETQLDSTYKHISSITIATIAGIGACVVAVVGALIAAFTLIP